MRNKSFFFFLVKIGQIDAAGFFVRLNQNLCDKQVRTILFFQTDNQIQNQSCVLNNARDRRPRLRVRGLIFAIKPDIFCKQFYFLSKCSNVSFHSLGFTKYSISICSNSRARKRKSRGAISFRNALPICAIPKGNFG